MLTKIKKSRGVEPVGGCHVVPMTALLGGEEESLIEEELSINPVFLYTKG
jgi:hypothetical protein